MTCADLLKALNEYVDGSLAPDGCEAFESHLSGCQPCQVVVDNVRRTIRLFKAGAPYPMPAGFSARLHAKIADRWKAVRGG